MLCKLKIETTLSCFCLGRFSLAVWGYLKLVISAILFVFFMIQLVDTFYKVISFSGIILIALLCQLLVDIVFHVKLVIAYHKKTEPLFFSYYKYTKIMWVIKVILSVCWIVFVSTGNEDLLYDDYYVALFAANLVIILVSNIIQSILWHTIMKERPDGDDFTNQKSRIYKADFCVEIAAAGEIMTEKEKLAS